MPTDSASVLVTDASYDRLKEDVLCYRKKIDYMRGIVGEDTCSAKYIYF